MKSIVFVLKWKLWCNLLFSDGIIPPRTPVSDSKKIMSPTNCSLLFLQPPQNMYLLQRVRTTTVGYWWCDVTFLIKISYLTSFFKQSEWKAVIILCLIWHLFCKWNTNSIPISSDRSVNLALHSLWPCVSLW